MSLFASHTLVALISFVAVFGIVVVIHELGHFVMARKHGVKVLEFGFGMPPRIWGIKKGDTLYSLNWIPIGGFVRTYGQNDFGDADYDHKDPENYQNKTIWQRTTIVVAGVIMNILLAIVLLTAGYAVGMQPLLPTTPGYDTVVTPQGVSVGSIIEGGPAASSDLRADDLITGVDSVPVTTNEDLSAYTKEHIGAVVTLTVTRDDSTVQVPIMVDANGQLGVYISNAVDVQALDLSLPGAFMAALSDTYNVTIMTVAGLGDVLYKLATTLKLSDDITGPVGIVQITYNVVQMGFSRVLQLTAILSLTLGIINVMPFPGLDGGHFLFLIIEKIRGKKLSARLEGRIHLIGFALLILLIVGVTIQDVQHLIGN